MHDSRVQESERQWIPVKKKTALSSEKSINSGHCVTQSVNNFNVLEMDEEHVNVHLGDPEIVHSEHILHIMNNLKGKSKVIDQMVQNVASTSPKMWKAQQGRVLQ